MLRYVVGCPAWDRAWSLDLWFKSVRANVDPQTTGLVFVVPPEDDATRAAIRDHEDGFAWVEVLRDRHEPYDRAERGSVDNHRTLAAARNRLLAVAHRTGPTKFISWDSDLLLAEGTVESLEEQGADIPLIGVWAWMNRHKPHTLRDVKHSSGESRIVLWEDPMQATAMQWEGQLKASHFPGAEWDIRASGLWRADVVLGFQMMNRTVYASTHYASHPDGEDIPFNWALERRSIPRYISGEHVGVHLYKPDPHDLGLGWPDVMALADCKPLAASRIEPRDPIDEALGFYETEKK
jgi:hypothetical protein